MEHTHFILSQFRSHPFQIHPWKFQFFTSLFLMLCFLCFQAQLSMASSPSSWDGVMVTRSDYQTLRAIRHDLVDFRGVLRTWNGSGLGVCSGKWEGIKCVRGQVIAIQLPWKGLGGKISDKIGKLQSLRKLSLHDNVIAGAIPNSLRFLPNLRGLYLFNNRLSGSIPPAIGNCLLLQTLDLSNNTLTGSIPPSIANATTLYRLNLSFNSLSGSIPENLARLSSLSVFALQHNNLSGPVPETWGGPGNGTSYRVLTLDHNFLSGSVPVSLGKLRLLEELDLSHNQISGTVPGEIGLLSKLQRLDLSNNAINGSFPVAFSNLTSLAFLNLESNLFSDQIPETVFEKMQNLSVLNLKSNQFNGKIPDSVGKISGIGQIDLSENGFSGEIPDSLENLVKLESFNVSYNDLSGPVPLKLSKKFNSSSFAGNLQLCGFSSSTPCPDSSPPAGSPEPSTPVVHKGRKLSTKDIILIAAGAILAILLLLCCIVLCCVVAKRAGSKDKNGGKGRKRSIGVEKAVVASGPEAESGGEAGGKLVHFEGPFVFTADDLLCATAEIMGKSTYGTAYKATLEDGNQVAVKRLREKTTKGQKEFEAEAATLGKIRHQNLLALRAYYLGPKGEKLLVFDYMSRGSLSSFLHARGPETTIDWATRMKIIRGLARGLEYLHADESMIHGNLTSSNVLLDEQANAHIADYGLSRLMTAAANTNVIATAGTQGYRAPELPKTKKANTKTDVYSLGVIILELLTGKSPGEGPNGEDLPQWVASIVKEEWTNEVFDLELMRGDDMATTGDELLNTLKLALHCVDPAPEARPEAQQVVQQLEEIRPEQHHQGGGGGGGGDEGALVPFTSE